MSLKVNHESDGAANPRDAIETEFAPHQSQQSLADGKPKRSLRRSLDDREMINIDLGALQKVLLYLAPNLHLRFLIDGG